jgi:hypothetical protein
MGMKQAAVMLTILMFVSPLMAHHEGNEGHEGKGKGAPPGQSKQQGTPPGLAKKGGMPPGLAKKFGTKLPPVAYIAIDPKHDDRAWFLIDDKWVLKSGFDTPLQQEVRDTLKLPSLPTPPPIPLPKLPDPLHIFSFK